MSRRRSASNPISLFPFLAVLICTMGSLILLLLSITRQAQLRREAAASAVVAAIEHESLPDLPTLLELEPLPPLPPGNDKPVVRHKLPDLPEMNDPRIELQQQMAEYQRELQEARKRAAAEKPPKDDRLASVNQVLSQVQSRVRELQAFRVDRAQEKKRLDEEFTKLKREVAASEGSDHVENRFAIVPYKGPNGTRRRPIFLECRNDSITLQPEGVKIGPEALTDPNHPGNPLAALLKVLAAELRSEGEEGAPYPLLIVRPDGIAAYYLAQHALSQVGMPIGYELIDDTMKLEYPKANEKLRELAQATIARAIREQWGSTADNREPGSRGVGTGLSSGDVASSGRRLGQGASGRDGIGGNEPPPEIGSSVRRFGSLFDAGPGKRGELLADGASSSRPGSPGNRTGEPWDGVGWSGERGDRNGAGGNGTGKPGTSDGEVFALDRPGSGGGIDPNGTRNGGAGMGAGPGERDIAADGAGTGEGRGGNRSAEGANASNGARNGSATGVVASRSDRGGSGTGAGREESSTGGAGSGGSGDDPAELGRKGLAGSDPRGHGGGRGARLGSPEGRDSEGEGTGVAENGKASGRGGLLERPIGIDSFGDAANGPLGNFASDSGDGLGAGQSGGSGVSGKESNGGSNSFAGARDASSGLTSSGSSSMGSGSGGDKTSEPFAPRPLVSDNGMSSTGTGGGGASELAAGDPASSDAPSGNQSDGASSGLAGGSQSAGSLVQSAASSGSASGLVSSSNPGSSTDSGGGSLGALGGGSESSKSSEGESSSAGIGFAGGSEGSQSDSSAGGQPGMGMPGQAAGEPQGEQGAQSGGMPSFGAMGGQSCPLGSQPKTFDEMMMAQREGSRPASSGEPVEDLFSLDDALARGDLGVPGLRVSRHQLRRNIVVECRGDRLILYPGGKAVPAANSAQAAWKVHQHAVEQLQTWNTLGTLHRWRPVITFYVRPDGMVSYYRMRSALLYSKLPVDHRLIDDDTQLGPPGW